MTNRRRPPRILHSTSEPYRFFGREAELQLLCNAMAGNDPSVAALVGPGGQGKTAILQHWLHYHVASNDRCDGVFFWSFYRGKSSEICLREWLAYAQRTSQLSDVSASYCVDQLLPILRRERWAVMLDGAEVVQHETGEWFGRFLHPELGRLLEELASEPLPGVVVVTSRFPLPNIVNRPYAVTLSLDTLDEVSVRELLTSLGVRGETNELDNAGMTAGRHAKAVELLGTYLYRFEEGRADRCETLPDFADDDEYSDEERHVLRVVNGFQQRLSAEEQDILALATAFRNPPGESQLLAFLSSGPVAKLLHEEWKRTYEPFADRSTDWMREQICDLIDVRLLERVGAGAGDTKVIDAHPLVRRGFENVLGAAGKSDAAHARAGFLRSRPDRQPAASISDAREEVELFHAFCDAGLWQEADDALASLDNPKHRFLAPAFELDLLRRFFPEGDWRKPPLWPRFQRRRSLAICLEMLGDFRSALSAYPEQDAPLRGDSLLALGELQPFLVQTQTPHPWQELWHAYRCHALCLVGDVDGALRLAATMVPVDIYEWVHVFECLFRAERLDHLDLNSLLYRPPFSSEHRWSSLARRRMRLDYVRVTESESLDLEAEYRLLIDDYDRGGMPFERVLTRLSFSRCLKAMGEIATARSVNGESLEIARRHGMKILEVDALELAAALGDGERERDRCRRLRDEQGYAGPGRP